MRLSPLSTLLAQAGGTGGGTSLAIIIVLIVIVLVLLVPVGDKWGAGALLNYERRLGDVADSPLSQSDDAVRTGVFIARRFGG